MSTPEDDERESVYDRWQDEDTWSLAEGGKRTPRQTALDASFHDVEDEEQ